MSETKEKRLRTVRVVIEGGTEEQTANGITFWQAAQLGQVHIDGVECGNIQSIKVNAEAGEAIRVTVEFFPERVEIEST